MNVAVITNILTPYRVPLFEEMRKRTSRLTVLLMAQREENRDWTVPSASFDCEVLDGFHVRLPNSDVSLHVNRGVVRRLRELNPDVVLSGGFAPANLAASFYCRMYAKKFVAWGELSLADRVSPLKRIVRRAIASASAGAIASSSETKDVFVGLGIDPGRVLTALMPIDVGFFNARARAFRSCADFLAKRATYPGPVLLSIGHLVDQKGYRELFAIYERVLAEQPDAALLILGDGPKRTEYEAFVRARGWPWVEFLGFRQAPEVVRHLALADVFVFPTLLDRFGAVLAEAMAAEVPAVSSCFAAATRDLVDEGKTGYCIDPRDTDASANAILKVLAMAPCERRAMGARAHARVRQHDVDVTAEQMVGFLDALPP